MLAVIVDLGIEYCTYTTVQCRRPIVPRRRGTNMERFASRSDVIKFPAILAFNVFVCSTEDIE